MVELNPCTATNAVNTGSNGLASILLTFNLFFTDAMMGFGAKTRLLLVHFCSSEVFLVSVALVNRNAESLRFTASDFPQN